MRCVIAQDQVSQIAYRHHVRKDIMFYTCLYYMHLNIFMLYSGCVNHEYMLPREDYRTRKKQMQTGVGSLHYDNGA